MHNQQRLTERHPSTLPRRAHSNFFPSFFPPAAAGEDIATVGGGTASSAKDGLELSGITPPRGIAAALPPLPDDDERDMRIPNPPILPILPILPMYFPW